MINEIWHFVFKQFQSHSNLISSFTASIQNGWLRFSYRTTPLMSWWSKPRLRPASAKTRNGGFHLRTWLKPVSSSSFVGVWLLGRLWLRVDFCTHQEGPYLWSLAPALAERSKLLCDFEWNLVLRAWSQ